MLLVQRILENQPSLILLLVFLILIIIILIFINHVINVSIEKKVRSTSERYLYAKRTFDSMKIEPLNQSYTFKKCMPSKASLDRMNANRQIISMIAENSGLYSIVLKSIENKDKHTKYSEQMLSAPNSAGIEDIRKITPFYKRYEKKENALISGFNDLILHNVPKISFAFTYTSPKGRNSYKAEYSTTIETLRYFLWLITNESIYKSSAQYQRSLMSASLRYDVMQRDGFRCVLCGRKASDNVLLHVDHIKPIAKGGKTELSNLRTLCQECNLGKRDKYQPNSYN